MEGTYSLAHRQPLRIELPELQPTEEQFDRCGGIAVRGGPDHLQLHLVDVLADLLTRMIAGSI